MVLLLVGMGTLGDIGAVICLVPSTLSAGVSRQSLTGGKGNLLGMGDRGGASGSEYITPRVGGKVEKVAS